MRFFLCMHHGHVKLLVKLCLQRLELRLGFCLSMRRHGMWRLEAKSRGTQVSMIAPPRATNMEEHDESV